jgi:hypothetical protein
METKVNANSLQIWFQEHSGKFHPPDRRVAPNKSDYTVTAQKTSTRDLPLCLPISCTTQDALLLVPIFVSYISVIRVWIIRRNLPVTIFQWPNILMFQTDDVLIVVLISRTNDVQCTTHERGQISIVLRTHQFSFHLFCFSRHVIIVLWHICSSKELWSQQRQPLLRNGSVKTRPLLGNRFATRNNGVIGKRRSLRGPCRGSITSSSCNYDRVLRRQFEQ